MKVSKCPITGLTKHQKDSWIIRNEKHPDTWASLYLLGDDIFVGEWHGYITTKFNDISDIVFEEILKEYGLREKGYYYILDNTHVRGTSIEVRSKYTPFLNREAEFMKSHILVGLTPVLHFISEIALRLTKRYDITEYHNDLLSAITSIDESRTRTTFKKKSTSNNQTKVFKEHKIEEENIKVVEEESTDKLELQTFKIDNSEEKIWRYKNGSKYYVYGEIIDERVIYCRQAGLRTTNDIMAFFSINYEMLDTIDNTNTILIQDIGQAKDLVNKNRKKIVSFFQSLKGKIGTLIFINPSTYQKASILMSKFLFPPQFNIHIVGTKGEAFSLAYQIKVNGTTTIIDKKEVGHTKSSSEVDERIQQLLNIVGRISWDPTFDLEYSEDIIGNDEFSILFESFEMLRGDIMSMKKDLESYSGKLEVEVQKATDRLKKQNLELEKAKEEAEKANKLKSAFLANISHEIRTPMNAIVGLTEILKEDNISASDRKSYLEIISKSNKHLLNLINDVVDISKIESKEMSISLHNFNLNELMKDLLSSQKIMAKSFSKSPDIEYELSLGLPDEQSCIKSDSTRLKQILINLLNNAYKFTDSGKIIFGYSLDKDILRFFVQDTGIGIEESKLKSIFDRFTQAESNTTRKYGGTGLGLSISKSLVELCGGEMTVESTFGKGSKFIFTIPYILNLNPSSISNTEITNKAYGKLNILIAEDDDINFVVLKAMLSSVNCNIKRAATGIEAVEEIKKNQDYDIILMDIQMPEMGGLEATKLIQEITRDIPIIAQTANAFENEMTLIKEAGCVDYLTKPINKETLIKSILNNSKKS